MTLGVNWRNSVKLRPRMGSPSMARWLMTTLLFVSATLTISASAWTETCEVTDASERATFTDFVWPTGNSIELARAGANPGAVTSKVYTPTSNEPNRNLPSPSAVVVRRRPVWVSAIVTLDAATALPVGSRTRPSSADFPVSDCAKTPGAARRRINHHHKY